MTLEIDMVDLVIEPTFLDELKKGDLFMTKSGIVGGDILRVESDPCAHKNCTAARIYNISRGGTFQMLVKTEVIPLIGKLRLSRKVRP